MGRSRELAELATAYDGGSLGFRNRIINGDMRIDQRNAGAAVTYGSTTTSGNYTGYNIDRWWGQSFSSTPGAGAAFSVQRSATAPVGFVNSLLATVTTNRASPEAASVFRIAQFVEGFNSSDLAWGTANAASVTIGFWARSSVTGTLSGAVVNNAENRSYPFTFSVSAANTWEYKTITVPGDTSGTWLTDNSIGLRLIFCLGSGTTYLSTANQWAAGNFSGATGQTNLIATAGATFYITGVQLEAGSVATPFERRDYGRELIMCQRYYEQVQTGMTATSRQSSSEMSAGIAFKVEKRAAPTVTISGTIRFLFPAVAFSNMTSLVGTNPTTGGVKVDGNSSVAWSASQICLAGLSDNGFTGFLAASAEL